MNLNKIVDLFYKKFPYLNELEKKTQINKLYLFFIFISFSYILIYTFFGFGFIINLFGLFYPAYLSFKSLQTKNHYDDTQWLTYWIVFSCINLCDFLYYIIPMYHMIKLFTIIWLFHNNSKGAKFIYQCYLEPFFIENEEKIDKNIDNFKKYIKNTIIEDEEINKSD